MGKEKQKKAEMKECILCNNVSLEDLEDKDGKVDWEKQVETICKEHKNKLLKKQQMREIEKLLLWF